MAVGQPDPQPHQFWSTSKGRTVEILARDEVKGDDDDGYYREIDVIAYKFLGGSMIHLRSVGSLHGWSLAVFQ